MAAKVSDVPNSKYHSLFFILGHRDTSAYGSGVTSCPSDPQISQIPPDQWQDGLPETFWCCSDEDTSISGDTSHHGEGLLASQLQGAVLWDRKRLRWTQL